MTPCIKLLRCCLLMSFFSKPFQVQVSACMFDTCSAARGGGGGIYVRGGGYSTIFFSTFSNCASAFGGGLVLMQCTTQCVGNHFSQNIASNDLPCPTQQCIEYQSSTASRTGGGGAIFIERASLFILGWVTHPSFFTENHASHQGGGIYLYSQMSTTYTLGASLHLQTQDFLGDSTGQTDSSFNLSSITVLIKEGLSYYISFLSNTAGLGGGAIAADSCGGLIIGVDGSEVYTLFSGNSASVGGAISLVNTPSNITHALFIRNSAVLPGTHGGGAGSYGCGWGQGGAICLVGDNLTSSFTGQSLLFVDNTATFGGALSVHASPSCSPDQIRQGCFTATLDADCNFTGNAAAGGGAGGAIFWAHPGNLVVSCNSSQALSQQPYGSAVLANISEEVQPCSSWGLNSVDSEGYGPVVASSPYYLTPSANSIPFYRSNLPISMNVSMQVSHHVCKTSCKLTSAACW